MRHFLVFALIAACSAPPSADGPLAFLDPVDLTAPLPPPGDLSLRIDGTGIAGSSATVRIEGLTPGERVYLIRSLGGEGLGPCHPALGGECLGVTGPLGLGGTAQAGGAGQAAIDLVFPNMPPGTELWLQAVAPRQGGAAMSHPLSREVLAEVGLVTRPANPTCVAHDRPLNTASASLNRVYPGVDFTDAVSLEQAPGVGGWWYVAEQPGRVRRFEDNPGVSTSTVALDIRSRVNDGGELGLLGMAFDPDFSTTGHVYLNYTASGPKTRISRFTSSDGGVTIDDASEEILLTINQPYSNHNGGNVAFGPDGMLYIGMGDGGSGNDPGNRAQNTFELLGKVLRIDVSTTPYRIPADNPWADGVGGAPEIYAIGMRNPWRYSFDKATGELWLGDVGQDKFEEISIIELGGNYGWKIREGANCRSGSTCDSAGMIDPVAEYAHQGFSSRSVVGGLVYRGSEIPELTGKYLYNDFYTGDVWSIENDPAAGVFNGDPFLETNRVISHWTYGPDDEAYALDYYSGVYRLERNSPAANDPFPQTLSATGCVDQGDPTQPDSGMIGFAVNHPFWSDEADKERWFALPDNAEITVGGDGDYDLPIGSVVMKHFRVDGALVETRLLMHHDDGQWAGYAYVWDANETDAVLLGAGETLSLPNGDDYAIPSRAGCRQCHTDAAGGTLGLEEGQLNRGHDYEVGIGPAHQITTLASKSIIPAGDVDYARLPAPNELAASIDDRARAWLHVNCSSCHRPDGGGGGSLDLRHFMPVQLTGLCDAPELGDLGLGGQARIVAPGDPATSVLSARVHSRGAYGMPPLGPLTVDPAGTAIVDAWISSMVSCP